MLRPESRQIAYLDYIEKDEGVAFGTNPIIILSMCDVTESSFTPIFIRMTALLNNSKLLRIFYVHYMKAFFLWWIICSYARLIKNEGDSVLDFNYLLFPD